MSIYISACWEIREEARALAEKLQAAGCAVRAGWLYTTDAEDTLEEKRIAARRDLMDITIAPYFITLTHRQCKGGGRHVELGMALAMGKFTIGVGPRENIFHELVDKWFVSEAMLVEWLGSEGEAGGLREKLQDVKEVMDRIGSLRRRMVELLQDEVGAVLHDRDLLEATKSLGTVAG